MPSRSSSARSAATDSAFETSTLRSSLVDVEDRRHVAVGERAEPHHGIAGKRLGSGDDDVRERLAQPLARPHQRAARAEPCDEHVDAVERLGDLGSRALVVGARVGLVPVLERHEVARVALGQLERQADGAVRALVSGRVDDLGAVEPQQAPALLRRVLRHHAGERVALELRDQRECDARCCRWSARAAAGPGSSSPVASAASIIALATRSLIEPDGFWPSSLA